MSHNRYRHLNLVLVCLMLLAVVPAARAVRAADAPKKLVMTTGQGDIPTNDPALVEDTSSNQIATETHYPLVRGLEEDPARVQPGMAEKWTISDDGLTYTFTIRQGISWVKWDGKQVVQVMDDAGKPRLVNAHDFEYGLKRTLDPATASNYAFVFNSIIVGAEEFNGSKETSDALNKLRDAVGVKATDDNTLVVKLKQPVGFALGILALVNVAAQPQWAIEKFGDKWTEPGNSNSYGPYVVSEWKHDQSETIVKNPFWPGIENSPKPAIDEIQFMMLDSTPGMNAYEAGQVDTSDPTGTVPITELDRIKADPVLSKELKIAPNNCTYYYGFNVTKEPTNNVHLRRAMSLAVDRQSLIDNVTKGGQEPARWISRPGMVAAPTMKDSPNLGIGYDPEAAKKELQAYLDEQKITVDQIPPITLMANQVEAHVQIAQAIAQMWQDTLGVRVSITTQEWKVFLETRHNDAPQVFRDGYCQDYDDASNFLKDVFHSGSVQNDTRWFSDEYDKLVDEAATLRDVAKRVELYRQAEELLVNKNAAVIPIYWYTRVSLTKPYVERTYALVSGDERLEKWDVKPH
jgi:oligopeptide transport system substrate-binding protein